MNPRTVVLLFALGATVTAPSGCSESNNHTPAPGGSAAGKTGSAGTPAAVVVVPVASCSGAPEPSAPSDPDPLCGTATSSVSFARDVAPLVGCTGESCHVPWSYSTLVGRPSLACCDMRLIVDPFHPSTSHLVQAVSDHGSCVGRMGALEPPAIATVVAWICQGAPDN